MEVQEKRKVCIVGGGPVGLASLRWVLDTKTLTGKLFEQKDDIGGLWNYKGSKEFATSPKNLSPTGNVEDETDPEMITAMYDGLRCNAPRLFMKLKGFPFHENGNIGHVERYPMQTDMHNYLREYATHFNLWPNIFVNTAIVNIRPETPITDPGDPGRWIVQTHNHKMNIYTTEVYDAVIICTGKHCYPYHHAIPGLETFKGKVIHSKYFQNREDNGFKGKNVVCIGLGASLADIVLCLSSNAKSVTACHKFPLGMKLGALPKNAREVKSVKLVTEKGVITEENEVIPCDAIILCTGFALKYPFLDPECGITVEDEKYIPHLYKMTVFTKRPTLAILNMAYRTPEVIFAEVQSRYFVSCLEGETKLPSFPDMESDIATHEDEMKKLGHPVSLWFQIGEFGMGSWKFFAKMAEEMGKTEEYKNFPLMEQIWPVLVHRVFGKAALYKNDRFKLVDECTSEFLPHHSSEFPDSKPETISFKLNPDSTVTVETSSVSP